MNGIPRSPNSGIDWPMLFRNAPLDLFDEFFVSTEVRDILVRGMNLFEIYF